MELKRIRLLFFILAAILVITCDSCQPNGDTIPVISDIIRFESTKDSAMNDGIDSVFVKVHIDKNATLANRSITFKTSIGQFIGGTSSYSAFADDNGDAVAYIQNATIGKGLVSAQASTVTITEPINFYQAMPDKIQVLLPGNIVLFKGGNNNSLQINALLTRKGINLSGLQPKFKAFCTPNDTAIGSFFNFAVSGSNGISSAYFSIDSSDVKKINPDIWVRASILNPYSKQTVKDSLQIHIKQ
jgi:hypothetical protein